MFLQAAHTILLLIARQLQSRAAVKGPALQKMPQAPRYPTPALGGVIAALQVAAVERSTPSTAFLLTTHLSQNSQNTAIILFY